jgi:ABC-2 type transport system permease protein/lipopolysaccharide transport system permease protein
MLQQDNRQPLRLPSRAPHDASGGGVAHTAQHLEATPETLHAQVPLLHLGEDALLDLRAGLVNWPLWFTIGWLDIKQRYRRSLIGPFWITLSVATFVAGLSVINSALFHMPVKEYLPFLATGLIVWTLIASLISEGCTTFIAAEGAIKQVPVPISVHIYRMVWRNVIIFLHNISIYVIMIFLFQIDVNAGTTVALAGLALIALNGAGFGVILGLLSARFRDIPPTIANLVQLLFLTTPIFWPADTLPPERAWVVEVNPFFYLVESVREPLLGHACSRSTWLITCGFTAVILAVACVMYMRFRSRIAYWL